MEQLNLLTQLTLFLFDSILILIIQNEKHYHFPSSNNIKLLHQNNIITTKMKSYLLFILILIPINSFIIKQHLQLVSSSQLSENNLKSCTSTQINGVYAAIASCDTTTSMLSVAKCISNEIQVNIKEKWNVFIKNSTANPDLVVFWYMNGCSVKLQNYGKYTRNFVLWPANYTSNNSVIAMTQSIESKQLDKPQHKESYQLPNTIALAHNDLSQPFNSYPSPNPLQQLQPPTPTSQPLSLCMPYRQSTVKSVLQICDLKDIGNTAQCISNRLQDELDEYWDVYISITQNSYMNNFPFDDCSIKFTDYGQYRRNLVVWKAMPN